MCDLHREEEQEKPRYGVTELVDELIVALTNARIYWRDHPRVRSALAALEKCLASLCEQDDADPLVLGAAEGFLFYKKKPLLGASISSARLIEALKACHAGGLAFSRDTSEADLSALVDLLAANKKGYASYQEAKADLTGRGCLAIRFLPEYRGGGHARGTPDEALLAVIGEHEIDQQPIRLAVPVALYQDTVSLLQDTAARVTRSEGIEFDRTKGLVETILKRLAQDSAGMMGLARYERHDAYTFGHSIRVSFMALNFASSLFDDEAGLLRIGLASLLHDIGKSRVPFEVLHSTTRLSPEERLEMNKHATHGGEILLEMAEPDPLAVATAFGHHQTLDGAGYPSTIHPVRQGIGTRIIKICDVYEALTAVRPYKPRMTPSRAYRVMLSMKGHFDLALLRRFIESNGIFPIGTLVRLSSGERARVLGQTSDPLAPRVRVETDDVSGPLAHDPTEGDAGDAGQEPGTRVVGILEEAA